MSDTDAPVYLSVQDADNFYILFSGYLVFFMQCGFAMLSAGSVRSKNTMNIILKNLLDASFGAFAWYMFGFSFAYGNGESPNTFIGGRRYYALSETEEYKEGNEYGPTLYASWLFTYAFAATAVTIVSGAVAERTRFEAYLAYTFVLVAWVYPIISHWVWDPNGWLYFLNNKIGDLDHGLIDFAGAGVVHMTGGITALWGAKIVGPRTGRFDVLGDPQPIPGHSASLVILGIFILWFGWYGFNPGSTKAIGKMGMVAGRTAVATTLSGAMSTITTLIILMSSNYVETGHIVWDVIGTANGTLAGLVSITGGCSVVQPWAAFLIGIISGFVYVGGSRTVLYALKIDDPLDAIAVHGFCGMWGLLAPALFADKPLVREVYELDKGSYLHPTYTPTGNIRDYEARLDNAYGFIMGGDGGLLVAAIVAIIVIFLWVSVFMAPFFYILKSFGFLRVSTEEEMEGLDASHHGGAAYPDAGAGGAAKIQDMETRLKAVEKVIALQAIPSEDVPQPAND